MNVWTFGPYDVDATDASHAIEGLYDRSGRRKTRKKPASDPLRLLKVITVVNLILLSAQA
jgi:hypothetical protein